MPRSLLQLQNWPREEILEIFNHSESLITENPYQGEMQGKTAAVVFFEASTRTRLSFETACVRLGLYPLRLDSRESSSISKGETAWDTLINIHAMEPSVFIIRCGDDFELDLFSQRSHIPVINAGWGKKGHPTQALLDAWTLYREFGSLEGLKILFVGDIVHSRVVQSNMEVLTKFGAKLAQYAPQQLSLSDARLSSFDSLEKALDWAEVVMALRVQKERHDSKIDWHEYTKKYQIKPEMLKEEHIVLHPGPVNWDVELHHEIANLNQCKILEQVSNGVFIRQTILRKICLDI